MGEQEIRILLLEDNPAYVRRVSKCLQASEGTTFSLQHLDNLAAATAHLDQEDVDVVLLDISLPDNQRLDALDRLQPYTLDTPVLILADVDDETLALEAIAAGAQDYLLIDQIDASVLVRSIRYALARYRDLRERSWAEETLRRVNRALIENATDVITIVDERGVIRDESPSVERVLGYTVEEIVGRAFLDFVHLDDAYLVRSFLAMEDVPGLMASIQFRFRHKDGAWLYLEAVGNDLLDDPAVGGIAITLRDVTERKRAEEALRRNNERLTVLHEIEQAVLTARSPRETAKAALGRMRTLIPYNRAIVTLFDLEAEEIQTLAVDGLRIPAVDDAPRWQLTDFGDFAYLQEGRHYLVDDLLEREFQTDVSNHLIEAGLRNLLHVPLLTSQKLIGSLNLTAAVPGSFDHNHVQIAYEVAGSLAIAIQNAQLLQEAQQQATQLAALYDTALNITSALDRHALLNRLAAQLQEMLSPDAIGVVLYDEPAGEVEVALAREHDRPVDEMAGRRMPLSEAGLSGWVIRQKQSLLIHDMDSDPLPESPRHASRPAASWLGVPLLGRDQALGAMSVQSLQPDAFTEEDVRLLESIAAQVAVALQNAHLYEQTRRRAQELEALEKVSSALRAARQRDEMFDAILGSLYDLLHLETAGVVLLDSEEGEWFAAAVAGRHRELQGARWPAGQSVTFRVLEDGQLFITPNLSAEPDLNTFARDLFDGEIAAACFPLSVGDQLTGAVWLFRADPFTAADAGLLGAVGDMAANALRRTVLYQRTLEHAREVKQLIETVPDGMLVLDSDNRIVLANPAAHDYLPLMTDARTGDVLTRLGDRPLQQFLTSQGTIRRQLRLADHQLIFEVLGRPIASGPQAGGAVLMLHDATEEHKRQQYLQAQERLATVGQLAAGIAHDFNNIMAIIILYSQSLERDPDFPKRRQYLNTISKQARHAASLIGQILDFSRATVMERSRLDLYPFVKEVIKLLERTLPETIAIELDVEAGDYAVKADPTRLQQVLMNLAVNARDAMPNGGRLHLALSRRIIAEGERIPLPGMMPGEWIALKISDTGGGIPASNLSHIFEPFFTTKERGKGTGLGLAQVYGIVKQHGGEIGVQSQVGEGTTFSIFLPALSTGTGRQRDEKGGASVAGAGELVLLVEDDAGTRQAMADILEMLNYRVRMAGDGVEGLALFEQHADDIALVISDMVMPEMGGMRLYQRLREIRPEVRVIFMTGYPMEEQDRELLEDGKVTWIQKPFTPEQIGLAIRDGLR